MRRILAFISVPFVAVLATNAWATGGGAQGKNDGNKSGGSSRLERQVQIETRFITIKATDSRQFEIDWIGLSDGRTTLFADASKGVSQEDQDRLNLSFIPFLSQVTGKRYTGDDVSSRTRVGSAWILDRILFVALDGGLASLLSPPKIIVLNDKWAFVTAAPALPIDWPDLPEFAAIAENPPFRDFATPNVSLQEAQTVLIGGLDTQEKTAAASRVPGLGDIPALGRLFLGSAHQSDKEGLIIFIKPSIIVPDE